MAFVFLFLGALGLIAAGAWWLSGFDTRLTGHDPQADTIRRGIRCAITVLLASVALWNLLRWALYADRVSGYLYLALSLPLALTWAGCVSELFARGFQGLVLPEDRRAADLGETERALDELATLVKQGKREEATKLCQHLAEDGNVSRLALETVLARMGVSPSAAGLNRGGRPRPLQEADRLRSGGKFKEAETQLKGLLAKEPSDQDAAFMLMRLYAQDLQDRYRAREVLDHIAKQKYIPPAFLEYAHRSIIEWCESKPEPPEAGTTIETSLVPANAVATLGSSGSADQLLAHGYFGTAIELLEEQVKARPHDFDLQMKLAEAHGVHCGNLTRAAKIIERLEADPAFTAEQKQAARAKLKDWKEQKNP